MDALTHYVGLDYHQHSLQVCIMDQQARIQCNRRIDNDLMSLLPLLDRAGGVKKIAIEACEGAAQLGEALAEAGAASGASGGWTVELAHPLYVNKLKLSMDKTDAGDAKVLTDLSRVGYLPKVWLPCASIRALRALLIEAAHRLVRTMPRWRAMCEQLMRRGKRKNVAVAAVANRWMRTVRHRMTVVCD